MTVQEKIKALTKINEKGCWLFQGHLLKSGYALLKHRDGKKRLGHRMSYEAFVQPIPNGLSVLHRCDVRHCWNPNHLFLGTYSDNAKDAVKKGRQKNLFPSGDLHPRRKVAK